jgi:hypothetical protein
MLYHVWDCAQQPFYKKLRLFLHRAVSLDFQGFGWYKGSSIGGICKRFQPVKNAEDLVRRVEELGFLPFTRCGVEGLSLEELTPPEFWFVRDVEGPWEWRQQAIERFAYGKFFVKNAGIVSYEWFPALSNFRRDGLDFDARYEDGRIPQSTKRIYELIER